MEIEKMPGLVIAYHGCDALIAERIVSGKEKLKGSKNLYDWLGHGQYFWENSPQRAFDWATELCERNTSSGISNPDVIGAVIDLGCCLNLMDIACIELVKYAYQDLVSSGAYDKLPQNSNVGESNDLLLRYLDCAVIEYLHSISYPVFETKFDSVRGVFVEGNPIYPNAGFREKTHIQICVVDPKCILGYFKPLHFIERN